MLAPSYFSKVAAGQPPLSTWNTRRGEASLRLARARLRLSFLLSNFEILLFMPVQRACSGKLSELACSAWLGRVKCTNRDIIAIWVSKRELHGPSIRIESRFFGELRGKSARTFQG